MLAANLKPEPLRFECSVEWPRARGDRTGQSSSRRCGARPPPSCPQGCWVGPAQELGAGRAHRLFSVPVQGGPPGSLLWPRFSTWDFLLQGEGCHCALHPGGLGPRGGWCVSRGGRSGLPSSPFRLRPQSPGPAGPGWPCPSRQRWASQRAVALRLAPCWACCSGGECRGGGERRGGLGRRVGGAPGCLPGPVTLCRSEKNLCSQELAACNVR